LQSGVEKLHWRGRGGLNAQLWILVLSQVPLTSHPRQHNNLINKIIQNEFQKTKLNRDGKKGVSRGYWGDVVTGPFISFGFQVINFQYLH